MFAFADPTELWIEITPTLNSEQSVYSNAASRWNGYLNQVCLEAVLNWIQTEHRSDAQPWPTDRAILWETVNGSAIQIGNTRLALIPTEAIDDAELAVPQEWVDIPDWVADYYLAVQVGLEPNASEEVSWIRVWGYATHQQLKAGRYDADDRTYNLDAVELTQDWSSLWVTLQFCPNAQTRSEVRSLPELPATQAENLVQRLANPDLAFPRLSIPFEQWGALMQNRNWRQRFYQARTEERGGTMTTERVNLGQWLQQQVSNGWQSLESLFGEQQLATAFRSTAAPTREAFADVMQAKPFDLADQRVALVIYLTHEADGRVAILVQLYPIEMPIVPVGLELKLLDETGEILQNIQAGEQDSYIQLRRFRCSAETRFQVQIQLENNQATESFVV